MTAYGCLSDDEKELVKAMVAKFVEDLRKGEGLQGCRQGLRVKPYKKKRGVWEITWGKGKIDGRALFMVGESKRDGEPHIIWLDCGDHKIF